MKKISFLLLLFLITNCKKTDLSSLTDFKLNNLNLAISFPAVKDESQRKFTAKILKELKVDKIRFAEEWSFREPTQGNFKWTPLDDRINWVNENNLKVLLTIQSNASDWACGQKNENSCVFDNTTFKTYIEKLLVRYSGKIDKIQFGNEWQSDYWYIGNSQEFTSANNILYDAVQEFSPNTTVVLGRFTTISLRYMAGCAGKINSFKDDEGMLFDQAHLNNNCTKIEFTDVLNKINYILENAQYDELDIHLYDDVENWEIYFQHFQSLVSKPIIVTEFGGPNTHYEDNSESFQAKRLYDYIHKLDDIGISEAYFFKLIEGSKNKAHKKSGLITELFLTKKEGFDIFKKFTLD